MQDRREIPRASAFKVGKILIDRHRSAIDCLIRDFSESGACLQVASVANVPRKFDLQIYDEPARRSCVAIWRAKNRIGIEFVAPEQRANEDAPDVSGPNASVPNASVPNASVSNASVSNASVSNASVSNASVPSASAPDASVPTTNPQQAEPAAATDMLRSELLAMRAALDLVPYGVVLLDAELRAQFINQAFRRMWRLPDSKADSKPAFVSLVYHGRDTNAYEIPPEDMKAHVAERVALVRVGDPAPVDLRLMNGEVLRFQCTALPSGGRVLCYTYVTDIVRHADELEALRIALDSVAQGITLLDSSLNVQFMNRAVRRLWQISDDDVARRPHYAEILATARTNKPVGIAPEDLDPYLADRLSVARRGDPTPKDIRMTDGRFIRSQCAVLPNGGRMLTYTDVSDLLKDAAQMLHFATTDSMTELFNRRHFLELADAEWQRFQRYQRPLSLLTIDIDNFKFINDTLGHEAGDRAIMHLARIAKLDKRPSDILGRLGGDEFALLLPETDAEQAEIVAQRLRAAVAESPLEGATMKITISVGGAAATLSMSSIKALMKLADEALYRSKSLGRNRVTWARPLEHPGGKIAAE